MRTVAHGFPFAAPHGLRKSAPGVPVVPIQIFVRAARLARKRRHHRDTVGVLRRGHAREFRSGRKKIPKRADCVVHRAGGDRFLPLRDQRHADAAFVQIALHAAKRAAALEERGLVQRLGRRSVIACEQHQRLLFQREPSEQIQNSADLTVQQRHHGRVVLLHLRPTLARVRRIAWNVLRTRAVFRIVRPVRQRGREVQKERTLAVRLDEGHRSPRKQIRRIHTTAVGTIAFEQHFFIVVPQRFGIVVVRQILIQITEKLIEALHARQSPRTRITKAPLAHRAGPVSGPLQNLGHGDVVRLQEDAVRDVVAHASVTVVLAGHQAAA